MPVSVLTPRIQKLIWDDHEADHPRAGAEFNEWVGRTAEKHGISKTMVRAAVARETQAFSLQVAAHRATTAQHVAQTMDLTMVEVLRTIRQGLGATRREVLYEESVVAVDEPEDAVEEHERSVTGEHGYDDTGKRTRKGNRKRHIKLRQPMRRPDGSFEYFEQPDFKAQLMATDQLIRVLGMEAPEQVEMSIDHKVQVRNLSQEAIHNELRKVAEQLKSLGVADVLPGASVGGDGAQGGGRSVLLANGMHQDEGRAGQDRRSIQAVSEEALHRATARRTRKRAGAVFGEESNNDGVVDCERLGGVEDVYAPRDGSGVPE